MNSLQKNILGLDIGPNSIGWALIECNNNSPSHIKACGVRVFPMGIEIDPKSGKNISLNKNRREARLRRRTIDRRQMRKKFVTKVLQQYNLLPQGAPSYQNTNWKELLLKDPYQLRAKALDHPLEPYEFGRIMLHLAQRRGFLSNRKSKLKEEDNLIKKHIDSLQQEMQATGARTLGEFLSKLDPLTQRKRGRYTRRQWYEQEFNAIWQAQSQNPKLNLNDTLKKLLIRGLFFQRPIKFNKSTIGKCELELNKYRAPIALLSSQQFRIIQMLNNTQIFIQNEGKERSLTQNEKDILFSELDKTEHITFPKAKKLLKLDSCDTFNFEKGGEKQFIGNKTAAKIIKAIGEKKWTSLDDNEKKQLVEDLMSIQNENALIKRAITKWGFDEQEAEKLADIELDSGYLNLSTKAILKLLPLLKQGLSYPEAVQKAYPNRINNKQQELLPPMENLRNPIVQRTLSELRHLLNTIIKKYGKPSLIRIELARDLKQNAKTREENWKQMRKRQKQREKIIEKILQEAGIQNPSRQDIEKGLLWEECNGRCPYTGKNINFTDLFSKHPLFDVEHIIPYKRCLDDSFANKTLCYAEENRNVKQNKTPYEAYGNSEKWQDIIARVKNFNSEYREEKLKRFLLQEVDSEDSFIDKFCSTQLNDTSYASRKSAEYIAQLYPLEQRKKVIQTSSGKITAYLRNAWNLNNILNGDGIKKREDHRHHAIDAIVIALTSPATVKQLAEASKYSIRPGVFKQMPIPWENFHEEVTKAINSIVVSHYVDRSVNKALHEETNYGTIMKNGELKTVIRKPLTELQEKDVENIVDNAVKKAVQDKLNELKLPPTKAFQDEKNLPFLLTRKGKKIPIKKVRIFKNVETTEIDSDGNKRRVITGNNHHIEVFKCKNKKGQETWRSVVVSVLEAMKRKKLGQPIVRKFDEYGNPLVFSLVKGDTVKMNIENKEIIAVVQKFSDHQYYFRLHTDARKASEINEPIRISSDKAFYKTKCQKLSVDYLGNYHIAND